MNALDGSTTHNDAHGNEGDESSFPEGEYQIIPVDKSEDTSEGDAINIPELIRSIGAHSRLIYIITGACLILGLLYALISPVEYQSEAKVMPELGGNSQSQLGGLLDSYGGLLGIDPSGSMNGSQKSTISPQVYPQIVHSLTFQHQMLNDTVYFANVGQSVTIYQYFKDQVGIFYENWGSNDELPQDLSALPDSLRMQLSREDISSVTKKELQVIQELRDRIQIEFDTATGVMTITAKMPDALAAAQICNKAIALLTRYLKEYHTQKANNVLSFAEEQYQIGRRRFVNAQDELANFEDQNVNLSTSKAQSRREYLQAEFDLAYTIYNNVAQKRIQARMNLQENTPVFKTLQVANVPLTRSEPRWIPLIIFSVAAGLILSFIVIAGLIIYQNIKAKY